MKKLLIFKMFLFSIALQAGVNLKNGNYHITYTDIIVPGGGNDLKVQRTYNSKSTEVGWFGFGWGSDFETFLTPSADGSVIVHENGAGAKTRFIPKTSVDSLGAAKKIVKAMNDSKALSKKVKKDLVEKLKNNAELRQTYARKYNVKSILAEGTKLFSNTRGLQEMKVTKKGYLRKYSDGKKEYFDKSGKLEKIVDKNGYSVDFKYENGKVKSIKDSQAKQLFFSWYPSGFVKHVWSVGDKKTEYKYEGKKLVFSQDIIGNKYKHKYDSNYNMLEVEFKSGKKRVITYDQGTQFVSSVTEKNGQKTTYKYESNPKNPDYHYWTQVAKYNEKKAKISDNKYEYEIKVRPDGSQYTYRIETVVNGLKTETIYSECCSLPLKITRGKHTTTFEYNNKGLLLKKSSTRGEYVELTYHKDFNKITKVIDKKGTTNFQYDSKGNLKKAVSSKGNSVVLVYDRKGRIAKMMDYNKNTKQKRRLSFDYNALGKPVVISMKGIGKINVEYDNYGEIKKVQSKQGQKMALQVTEAFQSLLSIVKPAGVSLNF